MIRCILKEGKEKPLEGRHPWVFSGAIDEIDEDYKSGDLVKVFTRDNRFLGIGYLNPRSQIAIRMLTFKDERIDEEFFEKKIRNAVELRSRFLPSGTNCYRVIFSEGDFLPGLIVDRYADYLVVQFLTMGMERWKEKIVAILKDQLSVKGVFERDDSESRDYEGLDKAVGVLSGSEPPDFVEVEECGHQFVVDIQGGQKTGFFLDQRENRCEVERLSRSKRVLNCFSYTGAFGVYAAKGGASSTVSVELSEPALNTAKHNYELNHIPFESSEFVKADAFEYLRDTRQQFDIIILDPPAFCKNKQQIQQASRGYKDINLSAFKRLSPGGLLFTFSCSAHISPELFQMIVFGAAKDAKKNIRILKKLRQGFDHPVSIYHPEGEYLKGMICEVE